VRLRPAVYWRVARITKTKWLASLHSYQDAEGFRCAGSDCIASGILVLLFFAPWHQLNPRNH
jgi:hypothetical protein